MSESITESAGHGLPLAGIVLLDLSRVLAGPVCSQVLGDLGATVIKVERPGTGDDTRQWGPPFWHGKSTYFQSVNRNKYSVTLDLRNPAGREVLDDLIRRCDLMLENYLPPEVEKFGLAPERLRTLNPRLVSCSISGFGRTGPWRDRPGYDTIVQAMSGMMSITGPESGDPYKVGVATTDVLTGLYAVICLLSGLWQRKSEEERPTSADPQSAVTGSSFDLALMDCTLASLVNVAQLCLATGTNPQRLGNAHATIVPYQSFPVKGGHLMLAVGNDSQFRRLCGAIGRPEWATDPRFAENPSRVSHRAELIGPLAEIFAQKTGPEWERLLTEADVPCTTVQPLLDALDLPQVQAREMVVNVEDEGNTLKLLRSPIRMDGLPLPVAVPPPNLGEHTVKVLREFLGYDDLRLAQLRATGALG